METLENPKHTHCYCMLNEGGGGGGGVGGGGQEGGLVTDHRDLKHKITNYRVFK